MARTNQTAATASRAVVRAAGRAAASPAARRTAPVALAGVALIAGVAFEHRTVRRLRSLPEPAGQLRVGPVEGRVTTVLASDGVPLHVVESGPIHRDTEDRDTEDRDTEDRDTEDRDTEDPVGPGGGARAAEPGVAPTLLFVHGFCVTADSWVFQQQGLADLGPMVFYDQRAHGRSGQSDVAHCTIDQLGDDLFRVLSERIPAGPVVLVGHSMGGMTVLALAAAHPELFGERVVAVALLSTSAGELARISFGLPAALSGAARRLLPGLAVGVRHLPPLLERARRRGSDLSWLLTRRVGFGSTEVPPSVVSFLETMVADTPVPVVAAFLPTLIDHDKLAAAAVLRPVPTLVLVGDADLMTPLEHSRALAAELPDAELVVELGAGHAVVLERPDQVNAWIRTLVARAVGNGAVGDGAVGDGAVVDGAARSASPDRPAEPVVPAQPVHPTELDDEAAAEPVVPAQLVHPAELDDGAAAEPVDSLDEAASGPGRRFRIERRRRHSGRTGRHASDR